MTSHLIEVLSIIREDPSVSFYTTVSQDGTDELHFVSSTGAQIVSRLDLDKEYERVQALPREELPRIAVSAGIPLDKAIAQHLLGHVPKEPPHKDIMLLQDLWNFIGKWGKNP